VVGVQSVLRSCTSHAAGRHHTQRRRELFFKEESSSFLRDRAPGSPLFSPFADLPLFAGIVAGSLT